MVEWISIKFLSIYLPKSANLYRLNIHYTLVSNVVDGDQTEILLILHNIEDRLKEIADVLKVTNREAIEAAQRQVLSGSALRKRIYDLCDGNRSVSEIAKTMGKAIQQVSNNITILQNAGLVKEVRRGKEKCYVKTR